MTLKLASEAAATAYKNGSQDHRKVAMDKLKELFGDKQLSYEEFERALADKEIKVGILSDGAYVDKRKYEALDADYRKQLEEKNKELETLKNSGNSSAELQAKIDALTKEKTALEGKQKETAGQLDRLTKRELASSKTGIHDPDFLDLMQARFGSQETADFEKSVVEYAEANKQKWVADKPSPDLNGEPKADTGKDDAEKEKFMRAAGVRVIK